MELRDFLQAERARILSGCTNCGKCYEACPMTQYAASKASASTEATSGVLDILRGGPGNPAALAWLSVCTRSGLCVPACPEHVDPKKMVRIAKMTALGGLGAAPLLKAKADRDYFDRIRAFARLQLSDEELEQWTR